LVKKFWQPTVLGECHEQMLLAQEDAFGPLAACFTIAMKTMSFIARIIPLRLAAYFYTQNLSRVFRVSQALESGMIGINECALRCRLSLDAFTGGVKESGLGREGSVLGLEEYLEVKTLHIRGL
jgi:succinate-semialdehyde dehydrogenase/glutarate-semialdehyde dehydrogenase